MSFFVQPTPPQPPKTKNVKGICLLLVAVFAVMALTQLFWFATFSAVLAGVGLPGGDMTAYVVAASLIFFELLSLPFLLGLRLSPAMRFVSMVAGWIVAVGWLTLSLWENITTNVIAASGVLGSSVVVPVGWWSVFIFAALGVLVVWASWGRWPDVTRFHRKRTRK